MHTMPLCSLKPSELDSAYVRGLVLVRHVVQVALGIGIFQIARGRNELVPDREGGDDHFLASSGSRQVVLPTSLK